MRPRSHALLLGVALLPLAGSSLRAQQPSSAVLDVTLGVHTISNGRIDGRTGGMLDLLVAARAGSARERSVVAGLGLGAVFTGLNDRCVLASDGTCEAKGNFLSLGAFAGVDQALGAASARLLAGPAIVRGMGGRSLGLQSRADFEAPLAGPVGIDLMGRFTLLPSHGGQTVVGWGIGLGLSLR